jgi:hypothetical protein
MKIIPKYGAEKVDSLCEKYHLSREYLLRHVRRDPCLRYDRSTDIVSVDKSVALDKYRIRSHLTECDSLMSYIRTMWYRDITISHRDMVDLCTAWCRERGVSFQYTLGLLYTYKKEVKALLDM